ncbi:MAG TPA: DinB family protein [Dehalococcoidia bacterium]
MSASGAQAIIERVQANWQPFRSAATALGPEGLERTTPAGWSAKAMLGTIGFWDEAAFGWITLGLRQKELPKGWAFGSGYVEEPIWPRAEVHNAREGAWGAAHPAADVLERCDRAHAQLLSLLETVTDEEAIRYRDYFDRLGLHYADHQPELEALLAVTT